MKYKIEILYEDLYEIARENFLISYYKKTLLELEDNISYHLNHNNKKNLNLTHFKFKIEKNEI